MEDLQERVSELKTFLSQRPEIVMAFVFGSYVNGRQTTESDFDVAVYFKPSGRALEWEEEIRYPAEDSIWGAIEKIIGIRTDFVVLNRAPATLAYSVIRDGQALIIKDQRLYWRFLLAISSAAEYFSDFVSDFWKIKERSASLSAVEKERLIRIVDFLETELQDYPLFTDITEEKYRGETTLRRNVERWVENIVNSAIDSAKIILASERKRIPRTYREMLGELALLDNFDRQTAEQLARFSKLRNILAHEYLDVRFHAIREFLDGAIVPCRELVAFIKRMIQN